MSYQWESFRLAISLQLRSLRIWAAVLLLPLFTLALLHYLPTDEVSAPVQVGIALPEEGGEALWQRLEQRNGTVVTFIPSDEETIRRQVASSHWDCGLLVAEDLEECVETLDTDKVFTLLIGPGSTVYPLVQETAAACLAELIAPGIAEEYLLSSGISDPQSLPHARLEKILPDADRVHITMETFNGRALDPIALADDSIVSALRGMIAVVLLVWVLFTAMDLARWLSTSAALRLRPLFSPTALLVPRTAAALLPAFCSGALALCLLKDTAAILALLPYLACLGAVALLLARFQWALSALPVLMPFVPVLCLLLSPILLDITLLLPQLAPLSACLPTTLYLQSCAGSPAAVLALCGTALSLPLLSLLFERSSKRR